MPGPNRRSKRLKQTTDLQDISQFSSVNPADGDLLIYDATAGIYENGKGLTGAYAFTGDQLITGSLSVTNDITISDALIVSGNANVSGDLSLIGAASLNSSLTVGTTLTVTGAATLSDNLTVAGATQVSGFSASGNATFNQNVTITGTATIATLSLTDLTLSGTLIADFAIIAENLEVGGSGTFSQVNATSLAANTLTALTQVRSPLVIAGDMSITSNEIDVAGTSGTLTFNMDNASDVGTAVLLLDPDGEQDFSATVQGIILPTGTNAERAGTPVEGTIRYDSDDSQVQVYQGGAWAAVGGSSLADGTVANSMLKWNTGTSTWVEDTNIALNNSFMTLNAATSSDSGFQVSENSSVKGKFFWDASASTVIVDSDTEITLTHTSAAGKGVVVRNTTTNYASGSFRTGILFTDTNLDAVGWITYFDQSLHIRTGDPNPSGTATGNDAAFTTIDGYNTAGTLRTSAVFNVEGTVDLYAAGALHAQVTDLGIRNIGRTSVDDTSIEFYDDTNTTRYGYIRFSNTGSLICDYYSQIHGSTIRFITEDSGGTARTHLDLGSNAVGTYIGFHGSAAIAKPTITGSRGGNAALASLLTALASYGLVTDSTT